MLSKGCGYGFQRCEKVRYVDSVLEENEKDDNSPKLYRNNRTQQNAARRHARLGVAPVTHARGQTNKAAMSDG
jgi:hypothetical protein